MKNLEDGRSLKVLHDAVILGVVQVSKNPAGSTVVGRDTTDAVKDTAKTALLGVGNVQELANVANSIKWDVSKCLVVGVDMVLLVHVMLMLSIVLKAKDTRIKETIHSGGGTHAVQQTIESGIHKRSREEGRASRAFQE